MAYDLQLEKRLRALIARRTDIHIQKMFGGLGFLLRGHMCFGIWKDSLILRLGQSPAQNALKKKNVRPFDITGRAMKSWVMVAPQGMTTKDSLKHWVQGAIDFVSTLPRK